MLRLDACLFQIPVLCKKKKKKKKKKREKNHSFANEVAIPKTEHVSSGSIKNVEKIIIVDDYFLAINVSTFTDIGIVSLESKIIWRKGGQVVDYVLM